MASQSLEEGPTLAESDPFGAIGRIAGVAEIADIEQAPARPVEQDEIKRRATRVVGMMDQHRRSPLDLSLPVTDERRYGDTLIRIHTLP